MGFLRFWWVVWIVLWINFFARWLVAFVGGEPLLGLLGCTLAAGAMLEITTLKMRMRGD